MSIPAAYIGVVFIWSTTPLATQWSTTSLSPMEACALRLSLAALLMMAVTIMMPGSQLAALISVNGRLKK